MIPYEWFEQAEERIAPHIQKTPLTRDAKRGLILKWENHQVTGSFKPRGALNKVLSLADWERTAGLVAASAGNHGQGVALAGRLTGAKVEVFVSQHAVPAKVEAMRDLGAQIFFVEGGYAEAETAGRKYAQAQHKVFISPYNDGQVIAGQGTIGLEIVRELYAPSNPPSPDNEEREVGSGEAINWIVPTGGGGLISALGAISKNLTPRPRLIAVQAAASPFTYSLFHSHTQAGVQDLPTLADGLSGAVEEDSVTIPMIEELVDDFLLVSEEEISQAIAFAWFVYHEKIEGSAAAGLAAVLARKVKEGPSVVILSGGNIQPEVHENIVARYAGESWN
jgi:threonine dehydratase